MIIFTSSELITVRLKDTDKKMPFTYGRDIKNDSNASENQLRIVFFLLSLAVGSDGGIAVVDYFQGVCLLAIGVPEVDGKSFFDQINWQF